MPQIAIAPIAPQAPPTSSSTSNTEVASFSPHLEQAISKQNRQATPSESNTTQSNKNSKADENLAPVVANKDGKGAPPEEIVILATGGDQKFKDMLPTELPQQNSAPLNLGQTIAAFINTQVVTNPEGPSLVQLPETASPIAFLATSKGFGQQDPSAQYSTTPSALASLESRPITPSLLSVDNSAGNPLLEELQRIIDSGEQGITLSIAASDKLSRFSTAGGTISSNTVALQQQPIQVVITPNQIQASTRINELKDERVSQQTTGALMTSSQTGDIEETLQYETMRVDTGDEPMQTQAPSRHNLQQQYIESKMAGGSKQENENGSGEEQQQNNASTAKSTLSGDAVTKTSSDTEPAPPFSQPLAQAVDSTKPLGHELSRPVTLPSGTTVHQEEVIRQIAERFQIARRDSDTRINLKLHPAELGELRIDLSVKSGTVRANVLASSQIAQDIIEKNMPRLRSILEGQGFAIEEIMVSNTSQSIDDFNLFDQHLFSQNDYTPSTQKKGDKSSLSAFSLDGLNFTKDPGTTGVNVTI